MSTRGVEGFGARGKKGGFAGGERFDGKGG